jgi:hypothetical protein
MASLLEVLWFNAVNPNEPSLTSKALSASFEEEWIGERIQKNPHVSPKRHGLSKVVSTPLSKIRSPSHARYKV